MTAVREIVVADIGGTNARFALARIAGGEAPVLGDVVTWPTASHASLPLAFRAFAERLGRPAPREAAIAFAGPVAGEVVSLTNTPWIIRPATLAAELGVDDCLVINDFGAVGHAVARLGDEHFTHVCGPEEPLPALGVISVVGPGTGLGVAHVRRFPGGYHVQETEGGHIDFAPLDSLEDALVLRLRALHLRVSVERVVAGPGLAAIHATLAALEGRAVAPMDDAALWTAALSGADPLAAAAVERLCLSLGAVAGDIALAQGAGAVVIGGGVGERLADRLAGSGFAARFAAKGRFRSMMAAMPVKLINHPQPGLFGAAAAFAVEHRA